MANVIQQLMVMIGADSTGFESGIANVEKALERMGNTFESAFSKISFSAIIADSVHAAEQFEQAGFQIQKMTGATGDALASLEAGMKTLYLNSAQSAENIASALSMISVKTGATGTALEAVTTEALRFAKVTGTDVKNSVDVTQKLFSQWGVTIGQQSISMDKLTVAGQNSGVSMEKFGATLSSVSPLLREMGFSFDDTLALVANFEKHGLDAENVIQSLKMAMTQWAKAGEDPQQMLTSLIERMQAAKSDQEALTIAAQAHIRAAALFTDAVRQNVFDIAEMKAKLADAGGTVDKLAKSTETIGETWKKTWHQMQEVVAPVGSVVLNTLSDILAGVKGFYEEFKGVGDQIADYVNSNPVLAKLFGGESFAGRTAIDIAKGGSGVQTIGPQTTTESVFTALKMPSAVMFSLLGQVGSQVAPSFADFASWFNPDQPKTSPKLTGGAGATSFDPNQIRKDFATLGIKDLTLQLQEQKDAWSELGSQGLLTGGQMVQAAKKIGETQRLLEEATKLPEIPFNEWYQAVITPTVPGNPTIMESLGSLANLPSTFDAQSESIRRMIEVLGDAVNEYQVADRNAQILTDDLNLFGIRTIQSYKDQFSAAQDAYDRIKSSGVASANAVSIAWVKMKLDQIELDHQVGDTDDALYAQQRQNAEDTLKQLQGEHVARQQQIKDRYDLGTETENMAHRTFDSLEKGLAADIVQWKGWSDTIKSLVQTFDTDLLSIMLKGFFKPLEDAFAKAAKQIGDWLNGLFGVGSSAAQQATSTASNAGAAGASGAGGVASAAAGGTLGAIGAIGSIGSFVTGIIGDIQNLHMTNVLGQIEVDVRSAFNELTNLRADAWSRFNSNWQRFGEILNAIQALSGVGGSGNSISLLTAIGGQLSLIVSKFDDFVVPYLGDMLDIMRGGTAFSPAGVMTFTGPINVYGVQDPRDFMQKVSRIARSQGVLGGVKNI